MIGACPFIFSRFILSHDFHAARNQVLKPADMAEYNRTTCLQNTRLNVIKYVMEWIADESDDGKKVLWIYGLAGTGKSTLSTTIAQMMRGLRRLGPFFFNRDVLQMNCATWIRTLAYQLATFDAGFGAAISCVVAIHENITGMPLGFQFANLLSGNALKLAEWSGGLIILVIDALDEGGTEGDRKVSMQALSNGLSGHPFFIRIIVVSRQESVIQQALGSHPDVRPYPLNIESATHKDVSQFAQHHLEEIRTKDGFLAADWPGAVKVDAVANGAGGLFIWAYIESHDPDKRLSELIDKQPESNSSGPFAQLDSLYKLGLQSSGLWNLGLLQHNRCDPVCTNSPVVFCHGCSPRITPT